MSLIRLDTSMTEQEERAIQNTNNLQLDNKISAAGSGSPKGVYSTLSALQSAHPYGGTGIYVVLADNKWYYWSGSAWTAGGTYIGNIGDFNVIVPYCTAAWDSTSSRWVVTLPASVTTPESMPNMMLRINFTSAITWPSDGLLYMRISGMNSYTLTANVGNAHYGKTLAAGVYTVLYTGVWVILDAAQQLGCNFDNPISVSGRVTAGSIVTDSVDCSDGIVSAKHITAGLDLHVGGSADSNLAITKGDLAAANGPIKVDSSGNISRATATDIEVADTMEYFNAFTAEGVFREIGKKYNDEYHAVREILQPRLAGSATGDPIATITDAAKDAEFTSVVAMGRTTLSGTPSPDAPVTISGVSPTQAAICGKNLSAIPDRKVQFTNQVYLDYIPSTPKVILKSGTKYTIAFDYKINSASSTAFLAVGYGGSAYQADIVSSSAYPTQTVGRKVLTFTTPAAFAYDHYLWIRFARLLTPGSLDVDISNVIIAFGEYTTLPYESYFGQVIPITPSAPMYDDDTYDAVTSLENHIKDTAMYDGNSNFGYLLMFDITDYAVFSIGQPTAGTMLQSNRFEYVPYGYVTSVLKECIAFNSEHTAIYIKILKSRLTGWSDTQDAAYKQNLFKNWLSTHNVMVLYTRATPVAYQHTPVNIPQPSPIANITADGAPVSVDYTRDLAAALALKADKTQEARIQPTLLNGATEFNSIYSPVRYFKDSLGYVQFEGRITMTTLSKVMIAMPSGYRSTKIRKFGCLTANGTTANIVSVCVDTASGINYGTPGGIVIDLGTPLQYVSLENIRYLADA